MKIKLLTYAVAAASVTLSAANATSFLSTDPVETVYDRDTAFDNPAYLLNTVNQLSFSDYGNAGYVNNAFGQKIGVHVGRQSSNLSNTISNADFFWAGDIGIGALGIQAGYGLNTQKDDFRQNFTTGSGIGTLGVDATTNYNYFEDDGTTTIEPNGTDVANLEVDTNDRVDNSSMMHFAAGLRMNDLPLDAVFRLSLPTSNDTDTLELTDVYNQDGQTTTTIRTTNTLEYTEGTERTGGLIASINGRFQLREDIFVLGGIYLNNDETTETASIKFDEEVNNIGTSTITTNQVNEEETTTVISDNDLSLMVGADHRVALGPAMFKIRPEVWYTSSETETTNRVIKDTFVNELNTGANTTAATGITDSELVDRANISSMVRVQAEYVTSEKWTWRAGTTVSLFDFNTTKTTTTENTPDQSGEGYEEDYVQIDTEQSTVEFLEGFGNLELGFTVKANDIVSLDVNIESYQNDLSTWEANFGLMVRY